MRVEINLQHNKIREFKQDFVANNVIIAFFYPHMRLLQFPHITRVWILYLKHQNTQRFIKSEPCQSSFPHFVNYEICPKIWILLHFTIFKVKLLKSIAFETFSTTRQKVSLWLLKIWWFVWIFFLSRYCHFRRRNQTSQRRH